MGIRLMLKGISRGTVLAVRSLRRDMRTIFTPSEELSEEEIRAKYEEYIAKHPILRYEKHPVCRYGSLVFRYGMLAFILGLLARQIKISLMFPTYDGDPYGNYVVSLMLLFNHLVFAFKWPRRVARALWILSWSWLIFGLFYILYLSNVLYPLPQLPIPN